ncbi:hypothetical protein BHM03_00042502 [Ensete ventricosum]|nr:hypothetical protein BHM03_00042502 [Ensete ventricosum]
MCQRLILPREIVYPFILDPDREYEGGQASSSLVREENRRWWLKLQPINHESPLLLIESHQNPRAPSVVGEAEYPDHNDALVLSVYIANVLVKRVMVDTSSSVDILYKDAFQKLGLTMTDLSPLSSTLTGFIGTSIAPLETIVLLVTLSQEP